MALVHCSNQASHVIWWVQQLGALHELWLHPISEFPRQGQHEGHGQSHRALNIWAIPYSFHEHELLYLQYWILLVSYGFLMFFTSRCEIHHCLICSVPKMFVHALPFCSVLRWYVACLGQRRDRVWTSQSWMLSWICWRELKVEICP